MDLLYEIKKETGFTLIKFTKAFTIFNYSIYVCLGLGILLFEFFPVNSVFLLIAVVLAVLRTVILLNLRYVSKEYLKTGSMFSISKPLSIKILNEK